MPKAMDKLFIDNDLLISEVEKRVCIHDISNENYRDRRVKQKAWEEVFCAVIPGWQAMGNADRIIREKYVKQRWRCLRDTFVKAYKLSKKNASGTLQKKQYMYFNQLSFVAPSITKRRFRNAGRVSPQREGNIGMRVDLMARERDINVGEGDIEVRGEDIEVRGEDIEVSGEDIEVREGDVEVREGDVEMREQDIQVIEVIEIPTALIPQTDFAKPPAKKKKRPNSFEERQKQKTKDDDADRMFLLSLLPQFRTLSPCDKMMAQIEFLQILRRLTSKNYHIPITKQSQSAQHTTTIEM